MGLSFFMGYIVSLFFNLKTKNSKGTLYKNIVSLKTDQGKHMSETLQMPALSLVSHGS